MITCPPTNPERVIHRYQKQATCELLAESLSNCSFKTFYLFSEVSLDKLPTNKLVQDIWPILLLPSSTTSSFESLQRADKSNHLLVSDIILSQVFLLKPAGPKYPVFLLTFPNGFDLAENRPKQVYFFGRWDNNVALASY